jgi:nucleotide-binding universal stress UspA family protein
MTSFRSILVPIDGSPPALAALEHAVALAEGTTTKVDVLRVTTAPPASATGAIAGVQEEVERSIDAAIQAAHARLGDHVAYRTVQGDPLPRIIEVADAGDYDLVVVGTHGRVGRLHSLLGSVAQGIVRAAPCPVLTVRANYGADEQSFAERRHGRPSLGERPNARAGR